MNYMSIPDLFADYTGSYFCRKGYCDNNWWARGWCSGGLGGGELVAGGHRPVYGNTVSGYRSKRICTLFSIFILLIFEID